MLGLAQARAYPDTTCDNRGLNQGLSALQKRAHSKALGKKGGSRKGSAFLNPHPEKKSASPDARKIVRPRSPFTVKRRPLARLERSS